MHSVKPKTNGMALHGGDKKGDSLEFHMIFYLIHKRSKYKGFRCRRELLVFVQF